MKVSAAHNPIIQKEVDELLSKGTIEPFSGGAGFYSSVFVVSKHTGSLQPILNSKLFNHYLHIPFSDAIYETYLEVIQHGDYVFSIDLQDAYLHILIVKHPPLICYNLFGTICHISRRTYLLGWPQPLVFHSPY